MADEQPARRTGARWLLAGTAMVLLPWQSLQAQQAPAITLPDVEVHDGAQNGSGPVAGYVAKRSTAGTKTSTKLIETPQSVSVIPLAQIVQQDAQNLDQVLHYTPGVVTETRGGIGTRYDFLTIRGFDADTYLDGLKLIGNGFYAIPQIDPFLLERVDVLRGPTSVLYGQAAAGGLIDQISKLPTQAAYHELGIEVGNYDHFQGTADLSGRLDDSGHWLGRLTALGRTENGQIATTKNERVVISGAITWQPDAQTSLTVQGLYQRDPRSTSYGAVPPQGTVLYNPNGKLPRDFYDGDTNFERFDRTQAAIGVQLSHSFENGVVVRSHARWLHSSQDYLSVYTQDLEADGRTLDRATAASRDYVDEGNIDTNAEAHIATGPVQHTLLAGFDYQHLSTHYLDGFGAAPSEDAFNPDYTLPIVPPSRTLTQAYLNQYGIYAQDQARLGGFVLTVSGRQDWSETYSSTQAFGSRTDQWDHAFTFRGGLTYVFANGVAPYASYSESFTPLVGVAADGSAFKPETGRQYEVGVKYQPPATHLLLTGAAFDLARQNLVTADTQNPMLSIQSGEAKSKGLEFEARATLAAGLDLVAAYTYLNTYYSQDNSGLQGKRLAAVPLNSGSIWADYALPAGTVHGLSLGAGVRYTGSTLDTANSFKVPDYTLVDATVSYRLDEALPRLRGATLYVNARNLLDTTYVASCYYGNWCAFGYGRQVMGGVRYTW